MDNIQIIAYVVSNLIVYTFYPIFLFVIFRFIIRTIKRSSNKELFKSNIVEVKKSTSKSSFKKNYSEYTDITKEQLKMLKTSNIQGLKDHLYDIFYRFEQAYNNLDYNTMKILSSKQLFNNYYTGISLDLKLGNKRVIENIEKKDVILYEFDSTTAKQSASLMIEIEYNNYVINDKGELLSGFRTTKITEKFEVEFKKMFNSQDIVKCNNCGATITGIKCNYCGTPIKLDDFRICAIRKIVEK